MLEITTRHPTMPFSVDQHRHELAATSRNISRFCSTLARPSLSTWSRRSFNSWLNISEKLLCDNPRLRLSRSSLDATALLDFWVSYIYFYTLTLLRVLIRITVKPRFMYSIGQKWLYLLRKVLKSRYGFPKTYMWSGSIGQWPSKNSTSL